MRDSRQRRRPVDLDRRHPRPREAIEWASALKQPAINGAGNQAYYGSSIRTTNRLLHELSRETQVTVLDCED
ncbi:hypothetical protein [Aromatoleum petrolei]|uniref:hypothetical protein n=1 Tax=Aromatoleum petrolei TaxID=76116 RepID=UPI001BB5A25F|nr:hypothetical protein [Aromatoleum petrolei]QTQ39074.1 Uncharacterized protein ToN1_49810 [Aromatoleum petrolei]